MTQITAQLKYLRIAPRKVRLVADAIRNKKTTIASAKLGFMPKRAARPILKLLNSARANARNNFNLDDSVLFIKEIKVDQGTVMKRYMPQARGRAHLIRKKTSHVTLVLEDKK